MLNALPQLLLLLLLLLANGFFAMSEIAIVSSRKSRLRELAKDGDRRAGTALAIADEPTRFLSTVQVGITLIGTLAGAIGGVALAGNLTPSIETIPLLAPYAASIALGVVVVGLTIASVIIGELVPKRIGLSNPEGIARVVAGPVNVFSHAFHPFVHLLTWLTERILKLFGVGKAAAQTVSEGEVNDMVQQGLRSGVFNPTETEMVAGVLELDQLPVTAIMTPRPKMVFLNLEDPEEINWRKIVTSGHSRFPIYQTNRDQVVGVVTVKAIWANSAFGVSSNLRDVMVPPLVVPETMTVIHLIEQFRKSGQHLALISDEFGTLQGLVTMIDIMEAIAGDMPERGRRAAPEARKREDGSWLIDATLALDGLKDLLALKGPLPHEDEAEFKTAGGFVMTYFGRIPRAGDHFDHAGWRFEVMDMDRHRIDKLLVARLPETATSDDAPEETTG
jgi:putative hemolysin